MKTKNIITVLLLGLIFVLEHNSSYAQTADVRTSYGGCTMGVASGKATSDGRPLAWKTRDSQSKDQEAYFDTTKKYKFVAIRADRSTTSSNAGVNEKGFAIVNSAALDLPGNGNSTHIIMYNSLGKCATIEEFEHYLDSITETKLYDIQSNYGVIDSTGAAAIYETTRDQYWKFNANDTTQAPDGYIVRTNFSETGGGDVDLGIYNTSIMTRYNRSMKLIGDFYNGDSLNYRSIIRNHLRDFVDSACNPIPVPYQDYWDPDIPYGYFNTLFSICRFCTKSAFAIQGVLPDESGKLSTMWTLLSDPATSIAVPYWPVCETPAVANNYPSTPLCQVAYDIHSYVYSDTLIFTDTFQDSYKTYIDSYKLRDEKGEGLWAWIFPAEDSVLNAAEIMLEKWRNDSLDEKEMSDTETSLAEYALSVLQSYYDDNIYTSIKEESTESIPADFELSQNYPNPFISSTIISYQLPSIANVELNVYDLLGQKVTTLVKERQQPGSHEVEWNASGMKQGVYYCELKTGQSRKVMKMILLRE
jgi:hypothetical protein